jgi:hypothetical protein
VGVSETPYVETEVLIAVMNGDIDEAKRLLRDCFPGELNELATNAFKLYTMANAIRNTKLAEEGRGKIHG